MARRRNSVRKSHVANPAFAKTASAAFQPKVPNMNPMSQPQVPATISTGGAAYGVSVPPMETFTNNVPSVMYFRRVEMPFENRWSRSNNADIVMAAGSVMNEPSIGVNDSTTK